MKKYFKIIASNFKYLTYLIFSKLTIFTIYILNLKKINLLYTSCYGFGDFLFFCVSIRNKLNNNTKIFCFSRTQNEIARFFFNKKFIVNSFVLMPKFMNEYYLGSNLLNKERMFKPTNPKRLTPDNIKVPVSDFYCGTKDSIKFIKKRISSSFISGSIVKIFKEPTLCLFIKNFSKKKDNHINFQVRQTRNLNKIFKLINFINNKKINIVILGKDKDHFIKLLPKWLPKYRLKRTFLFKNLSDNYSIGDQAYAALNSIGYIGSASGANGFFGLLNKKAILIDAVVHYSDKYWKETVTFLYKRVLNKKNKIIKYFFWKKTYDSTKYRILETNYYDIKNYVKKIYFN